MSKVGQRERETQDRVVKLFTKKLGYAYLGNWHERENNKNIEEEYLRKYLNRKGYGNDLINRAVEELLKLSSNQTDKLYYVNKEVYSLLRYGAKVKEGAGENNKTVSFINWENPYDNDFYIAEEVSVKGEHTKRPDIVLYINGIALGVIELKRSIVSVSEGIRQNLDNQSSHFIKPFFHTMQLVMAGNDTEGLRYGTIETKEKYYLTWKEDEKATDDLANEAERLNNQVDYILDKHIIGLCHKERFLEIIHDFIVFDRGTKKLCRPNQYFGVRAATRRVKAREGGIIWHTQGSGKSLTMVWLTKWIREHIPSSRVLIITDRDELDKQIEKVFKGVDEEIYRTKSGKDLIEKLNATTPLLLNSLIHKFAGKDNEEKEADYEAYIQELKNSLPKDFKAKGDIYVFVDECHRTQSGKLHDAMKAILPNALFIGFAGTPLLKKDKKKSIEIFGTYIHTYKFNEAVADKVVLDLQYEARDVDQNITSQDKIDQWFETKTKGLTEYAKVKLKQKWGTMQRVLSSKSRLDKIVNDIIFDMETKDRLQNGRGNAILIAGSIYEACKYYELFQQKGLKKCAIITSYTPNVNHIKGENTGEDDATESIEKYEIYQKMLNGKKAEDFEEEVKNQFINEPAQMKLLIVVDKLLTGFDAPPATYLYIDKKMQDHGLFQAICRVNRLDGEDKEYGYVVDYKDLFKSLEKSIEDYTTEAFEAFEEKDVEGLLKDRLKTAKERLDTALESLKSLCEPVPMPKDTLAYIRYFCAEDTSNKEALKENEQKRSALYKYTVAFIRAYANIANEMIEAGYTASEIETMKKDVKYYDTIRSEVMHAAGDYIDLKYYEPAMRHLIDSYISAEDSKKISEFDDLTLIELIVAKGEGAVDELPKGIKNNKEAAAETIENNVRRLITDETPTNPKYYENMSVLLDQLIQQRKEQVLSYEEYLKKIVELTKNAKNPSSANTYPRSINSGAKRALYDNLGQDEDLALSIDCEILSTKPDDWRSTRIKRRVVKNAIKKFIYDEDKAEELFKIAEEQGEY
ncbi:type I restriction endonuclease subunit R [Clostridium formicaceticum]|uniref:Type I restriction enzyme endonuclease subunit n=1 Tax=Clostridium formicaceticum TaxID=1497 RepID=A0AAC9RRX6_9CLOT|nr:HsdR family type I site-specific deoxyribonuclease [Clostridium formicaceticum]AOY74697.1 restriction endonuclease subunit R [Clostridium formicaceticum]ARE89075.1 Type-1 restriction enzyme R protein [Clostridium formicaceticum]